VASLLRPPEKLKKILKVSTLSFQAGTAEDRLLGPYFLPPRLTGAVDRNFLRNILSELLKDVDVHSTIHLWYIHNGTPLYLLLEPGEVLDNLPQEQWNR
jgi:hypothetical protein